MCLTLYWEQALTGDSFKRVPRPEPAANGITLSQLALAWVLRRAELTAAIVGSRKPEQIQETVQAGDIKLTEDEIARVEEFLKDRELAFANLDMSAFANARF